MTRDDITVLMTGAGAPGASGIVKSLRSVDERDIRIVGVDMDDTAYGFTLVDEHYTVPAGTDDEYVPRMRELARKTDVDVILPLTTGELNALAAYKAEFERMGVTVMVSDEPALEPANNKGKLYAFLESHDLASAPEYRHTATEDEFVDAVHELGYPDNPVVFKQPVASGMRGFRVLDDSVDRLDMLMNQKPDSTVTTLDEVLPVLTSADEFPSLAVMEHLPGSEYSVDVVAMGDEVGPVIPRERSRTRAGISFEGVVEDDETLAEEAAAICRELGLEYNVNIQFKYGADGTPKVLEINPRVSGTIVMCVGAGANMPYYGVKYALGEAVPDPDIRWGTQMTRYWQEVFRGPDGETFRLPSAHGADEERASLTSPPRR